MNIELLKAYDDARDEIIRKKDAFVSFLSGKEKDMSLWQQKTLVEIEGVSKKNLEDVDIKVADLKRSIYIDRIKPKLLPTNPCSAPHSFIVYVDEKEDIWGRGHLYSHNAGVTNNNNYGWIMFPRLPYEKYKIFDIQTGTDFTLVLAEVETSQNSFINKIFTIGLGSYGKHGIGNDVSQFNWCEPKIDKDIAEVYLASGGYYHDRDTIYAIAKDREDGFVWGCNENGQCGQGTTSTSYKTPQRFYIPNKKICGFDATGDHAGKAFLIVNDTGNLKDLETDVYSTGYGGYGNLGHGDRQSQKSFKKIDALSGKDIVEVQCTGGTRSGNSAYYHSNTYFTSFVGDLYSCGNGAWGDNLNGATNHVLIPTKVDLSGRKVKKVYPKKYGYGGIHVLLVDETLLFGGHNNYGHGETGDNKNKLTLVEVATNVTDVFSVWNNHYCYHAGTFIVKKDGLFYSGYDGYGQSGL
jgi:hypothetical protein